MQSERNRGIIEMLTILVWDFSNSKAFADKTVEAFFVFARNFEMAIGEKPKFELADERERGERSKRIGEIEIIYYIKPVFTKNFFTKNYQREINNYTRTHVTYTRITMLSNTNSLFS